MKRCPKNQTNKQDVINASRSLAAVHHQALRRSEGSSEGEGLHNPAGQKQEQKLNEEQWQFATKIEWQA